MRPLTSAARRRLLGSPFPVLAVMLCTAAAGCSTMYYRALETVGIEKRDILVSRVENARDAQMEARDQFVSALDAYRSVVQFDGGDLEERYDLVRTAYERSDSRASTVTNRIDSVQQVAEDLFAEWERELDQYTDQSLRRQSESLLRDTRSHYRQVMTAMRRAEDAMQPVLALFQDQVLVLRHNLNARAIGALEHELRDVERATTQLIREMERAIAQASDFIEAMA